VTCMLNTETCTPQESTEITSSPPSTRDEDGRAAVGNADAADAGKAAAANAPAAVANDIYPLRQSYREIATQFGWLGVLPSPRKRMGTHRWCHSVDQLPC
jgi:hypothetical protein